MSQRHRAPTDGIVATSRPKGWPATRWMATIEARAETHHAQLARGRTLARSGRVRDLWFSPGLGSAEVIENKDAFRVTVRVRVFVDEQWDEVVSTLVTHLSHIAAMLEGDMPEALVQDLDARNLHLLPGLQELDGICECGDFHMPCAHMAAVHNVIAEALDGDPFLLLTLRGLTRAQLLGRLRRAWGDNQPLHPRHNDGPGPPPPPEQEWAKSPKPVARLAVPVVHLPNATPGLRALGPAPGGADLGPALEPLYAAGAKAAAALAFGDAPDLRNVAPTSRWQGFSPGKRVPRLLEPDPQVLHDEPTDVLPPAEAHGPSPLTERLVDVLATQECASSKVLAELLDAPVLAIRQELLDLERLGIVYRTGQTRGTRWWLG